MSANDARLQRPNHAEVALKLNQLTGLIDR